MNVNREMLAFLRKQYPVGTRIRLDSMQDPYAPVEAGMTGKLDYIDDAGQFHMKWDNGRALALIPGVDSFINRYMDKALREHSIEAYGKAENLINSVIMAYPEGLTLSEVLRQRKE